MICSGGLATYCADAQATADLLRTHDVVVVAGNVEERLSVGVKHCGCGFNEGSACDVLASSRYDHAGHTIYKETNCWMGSLPHIATFTMSRAHLAVAHGGVTQTNRSIFPATPDEDLRRELQLSGTDGVIAEHSKKRHSRQVDSQLWHNAGAISMPANDRTLRLWYSVVTPGSDSIYIKIQALDFNWRGAVAKIRAAGLSLACADALEIGLWPRDKIISSDDQAQPGRPLTESALKWSTRGVMPKPKSQRIAAP